MAIITKSSVQISYITVAILSAFLSFDTRAAQIRPGSLTIAGENYRIIYRKGGEKRSQAIVTLDGGKEIMGEAFLMFRDGQTLGTANAAGKHYRIDLTREGTNMVEVPDAPKEPAGRPDTVRDPNDGPILNRAQLDKLIAEKAAARKAAAAGKLTNAEVVIPPILTNSGPIVITIMVLYDQAAVSSLQPYSWYPPVATIQDTIEMSVAQANEVYTNCGIDVQLNLVYSGEIACNESGSLTTDLYWLAANTNVAALQAQYGADVVTLMEGVTDIEYSGMAFILSGTSTKAFNVVEAIYSINDYALAHEVGHNLGCAHDIANAAGPGAYPYSYGYNFGPPSTIAGELAYGTIMCYPGSRSGMFSSPTNYYLGYATGTESNNNVATINLRAPWIASITPQPTYTATVTINGSGMVIQNGVANESGTVTNPPMCVVTRGQSVNLVASGNFICWTGATNTTSTNITLYPSQTTNLVANFVGVSSLAPQITVQPQGQTINTGRALTLTTAAVGVPTPNFQWQLNGANIGTGSTLTIPNITVADRGNYQCLISNAAGSVTSSLAAVVVNQTVRIPQPQFLSITPSIDGQISLLYFGTAGRTYQVQTSPDLVQWEILGSSTATAAINQFIDANADQSTSRYYRLMVVQ